MEKLKDKFGNFFSFYRSKLDSLNKEVLTNVKVGESLKEGEMKEFRILSGEFIFSLSNSILTIENKKSEKKVELSGVKRVIFRENYIEVFSNSYSDNLGLESWTWHIDYKKLFNNLK